MSLVSSFYVRSSEHKYVKWHKAPGMLAKAVATALPPLGCGRLQLARANEVLEGHGRDLDNPGQGGFGDLFLQEQCNFRLLAIELGFAQGPLGAPQACPFGLCRRSEERRVGKQCISQCAA